jgi:6-phosphogluconolactonase
MTHLVAIAAVFGILMTATPVAAAAPTTLGVYVGTDTHDPRKGIYRLDLDPATGRFVGPPTLVAAAEAPEFLAMSADGSHLYASNAQRGQAHRPDDGTVDAYAVSANGNLQPLRRQPSGGDRGTYLLLDGPGKNLFTVAYGAANVALLPVAPDGQLQPPAVVLHHLGSSVNHARQAAAHPHSITLDPAGRFAFVPDLGCDKIFVYRVDSDAHTLAPNDPPFVPTPPGSGPRRICFAADGRFAYAVTEMGVTALAYRYDPARGMLFTVQAVPLLHRPATADDTGSEIALGAGDRFLYASIRGDNTIVVMRRDPSAGTLTPLAWQSTLGKTPRHFAIDPTGRWLLAANQNSASVTVFKIDPETGTLSPAPGSAEVASPTCVLFDRVARPHG